MNKQAVIQLTQLLLKNYENLEVMEYKPETESEEYNMKLKLRIVIEGEIK